MATESLVESRIEEGERLLAEVIASGLSVRNAFWLRLTEDSDYILYFVTPEARAPSLNSAYKKVYDCIGKLPEPWIEPSEIKLIPEDDALAKEMGAIRDRLAEKATFRIDDRAADGTRFTRAYIYSPFAPGKSERRRLMVDVEQIERLEDYLLSADDRRALNRLIAQGVSPEQAYGWIRKRRATERSPRRPIPAGTEVNARVAAFWGDKEEDDPDPLLMVETPDGARGLVMKRNTEPVD